MSCYLKVLHKMVFNGFGCPSLHLRKHKQFKFVLPKARNKLKIKLSTKVDRNIGIKDTRIRGEFKINETDKNNKP